MKTAFTITLGLALLAATMDTTPMLSRTIQSTGSNTTRVYRDPEQDSGDNSKALQAFQPPSAPGMPVSRVHGLVVPATSVPVRMPVSGVIEHVVGREGRHVAPGEELLRLDDRQRRALLKSRIARLNALDESIRAAKADAQVAQRELERRERANERRANSVSQSQVDKLEYERHSATVRIAALRNEREALRQEIVADCYMLADFSVRAPIAGQVGRVEHFPGQYVAQGDTVFWIHATERLLKIQVTEPLADAVADSSCEVTVEQAPGISLSFQRYGDYNPDGTRDVFLRLSGASDLPVNQVVQVAIVCRGAGDE